MKSGWKVFLMALAAFVFTTIATISNFSWPYVAIVTIVFTGGYAVKNWLMPSTSPEGTLNWRDIVSGIIVALCAALADYAGTLMTDVLFTWQALWAAIASGVMIYFTKTLPAGVRIVKK
jgi:hypothetical protein